MNRTIVLEPVWKLPRAYGSLIEFPPEGFQFREFENGHGALFKHLSRWSSAYAALWALDSMVPPVLAQSWFQRRHKPPQESLLTYAHGHVVFRREPWVVEVEYLSMLLGMDPKHLRKYQSVLERALASPYCRGIRCWSEAGRKSLLHLRNFPEIENKIFVIPHAIAPRPQSEKLRRRSAANVRLLFVGSANIKGEFDIRGGRETLEAFIILRNRYSDLELTIRSDIPVALKRQFSGMPGLRIIEDVIPWDQLEQEFADADIFVLPTHSTPPFLLMDAMSHGLPIVTLDSWANSEIVNDGRTGVLVKPSLHLVYFFENTYNPNFGALAFRRLLKSPDPIVVQDLAAAIAFLVERPRLGREMGLAARREIERGRFSIRSRNQQLGPFLEAALPV